MNSILNASLGYGSPAPKPAQSGTGDAGTHLSAALAAHKKGDHKKAKHHALMAANRLHAMSQAAAPAAPPPADPSAPPAVAAP